MLRRGIWASKLFISKALVFGNHWLAAGVWCSQVMVARRKHFNTLSAAARVSPRRCDGLKLRFISVHPVFRASLPLMHPTRLALRRVFLSNLSSRCYATEHPKPPQPSRQPAIETFSET